MNLMVTPSNSAVCLAGVNVIAGIDFFQGALTVFLGLLVCMMPEVPPLFLPSPLPSCGDTHDVDKGGISHTIRAPLSSTFSV